MSAVVDTYIAYRIITILVKPWNRQDAYEFGIIDEKGKVLRKYKTLKNAKEKASYTLLIRFVFNLKRILAKLPGGKSKMGSYAVAALVFLREEAEDNKELKKLLGEDYAKEK
jgi:ADP-glucose pyrophosphorylase